MDTPIYANILVPVDGSPTSRRGMDEALRLAKGLGSRVRLLHVVNELIIDYAYAAVGTTMAASNIIDALREAGKHLLAEADAQARAAGVEVDTVLVEAMGPSAAQSIVEHARQWPADLIVIGSHGRRGLRRLTMGSDAEEVIRTAPVPVLLVRAAS